MEMNECKITMFIVNILIFLYELVVPFNLYYQ